MPALATKRYGLTILFKRDDIHFEAGRALGMHMMDTASSNSRAGVLVSYRSPIIREEFEALLDEIFLPLT